MDAGQAGRQTGRQLGYPRTGCPRRGRGTVWPGGRVWRCTCLPAVECGLCLYRAGPYLTVVVHSCSRTWKRLAAALHYGSRRKPGVPQAGSIRHPWPRVMLANCVPVVRQQCHRARAKPGSQMRTAHQRCLPTSTHRKPVREGSRQSYRNLPLYRRMTEKRITSRALSASAAVCVHSACRAHHALMVERRPATVLCH